MESPIIWTLDEAAQVLRMSKSKLRHEERAGRLKFLRFGRVVRVDARDLESYVNSVRGSAGERLATAASEGRTNQSHTTGTVPEALTRSISELRQLIATIGPETPLGLGLTTVKGGLQRIDQGLPADRECWLSVAAALRRARGGSPS